MPSSSVDGRRMAELAVKQKRRSVRGRTGLLLATFALPLAACGQEEGTVEPVDTPTLQGEPVESQTLAMVDDAFQPEAWAIPGSGTYTLRNDGAALHNLTLEEAGLDVDLQPRDSQQIEIELDPGTYGMVCAYHVAQGMTGALVVG
jgi:plastocyanin